MRIERHLRGEILIYSLVWIFCKTSKTTEVRNAQYTSHETILIELQPKAARMGGGGRIMTLW